MIVINTVVQSFIMGESIIEKKNSTHIGEKAYGNVHQ